MSTLLHQNETKMADHRGTHTMHGRWFVIFTTNKWHCRSYSLWLLYRGGYRGAPGAWAPPDHQKWGPSTKIVQKLRPTNGSFRPLNNLFFFKTFSLALLGIKFWLLIISIFSRLTMLTIALCIYVSMHQFIFIGSHKLYIIQCTFIMNIYYGFYVL